MAALPKKMSSFRTLPEMSLEYLLDAYKNYEEKEKFFLKNGFIDRLAGSDELRKQIVAGKSEKEIRASWEDDLEHFREMRKKYLLYL